MSSRIYNINAKLVNKGFTYRESLYDCKNHEIHLWRVISGDWIYPHIHPETDDIWYIVEGHGDYYLTSEQYRSVRQGDLLLASPKEVHGLYNSSNKDLLILSVLAPLPVEYGEAPGFEYPIE